MNMENRLLKLFIVLADNSYEVMNEIIIQINKIKNLSILLILVDFLVGA